MELYDLRTSHESELLGTDQDPYFSWKMKSDKDGTLQEAYQIVLKDPRGRILWDSGKVQGRQSAFIPYKGCELESTTRYTWEVTVWDNHRKMAAASSWFETAFLRKTDWAAAWVSSGRPEKKRKKGFGNQPAPVLFRRSFTSSGEIAAARLYATCHGIYQLSINGLRPDDRDFAPEYSSYEKYLSYQTYDVTGLLKEGENVLGMYVADGWYFGAETAMSKKALGEPYSILYQLEISYRDGRWTQILSDGSEKWSEGPCLHANLFAGEKYDARLEQEGWDEPGFEDRDWRPVKKARFGYDNLAAQIGAPVRIAAEVPAERSYVSPKGENIIDFGQVMAGRVRMHVNAPAGTEITLDHFEIPDKEGNYFNNILGVGGVGEGVDQKVVFVSDGVERDYEAMFSFQGFRYIRVSGLSEVRAEDFTAVALSTDKEQLGTFRCSDERLNRLYENTLWSQRSNMISIPTDCPQREKAGWTGDIGVYADTSLLNEDTTGLLTRWLKSLSADQAKDGGVPIVSPLNVSYSSMQMLLKFAGKCRGSAASAGWGDACWLVPMAMYRQTGNREILKAQYPSMKAWCDYIIRTAAKERNKDIPKETDKYLWSTGFHFGEWLIPSQNQGGINMGGMKENLATGKLYVPEIYGVIAMRNMAETAKILGRRKDEEYYSSMADRMAEAFAEGCINPDGTMKVPNMGAYVMPFHYGLVPEQHKDFFRETILKKIKENGGCLDTGFLGTPVILDTLCEMGEPEKAYDLLFQTKAPSWIYEVENGATTIWESWHATDAGGNPAALSLNHYAFGCVDDWMFRNITGIVPTAPGYQSFRIAPVMDSRITSASRSYETEYGTICVNWVRGEDGFRMTVEVPCNTEAEIVLPDGNCCTRGSGTYDFHIA